MDVITAIDMIQQAVLKSNINAAIKEILAAKITNDKIPEQSIILQILGKFLRKNGVSGMWRIAEILGE